MTDISHHNFSCLCDTCIVRRPLRCRCHALDVCPFGAPLVPAGKVVSVEMSAHHARVQAELDQKQNDAKYRALLGEWTLTDPSANDVVQRINEEIAKISARYVERAKDVMTTRDLWSLQRAYLAEIEPLQQIARRALALRLMPPVYVAKQPPEAYPQTAAPTATEQHDAGCMCRACEAARP